MVPRVHPNGFLQLDLDLEGVRRLHVWDSRLPRQSVRTPIHDHAFSFRSEVIAGELTNLTYEVEQNDGGDYEFWQRVKGEGEETTLASSGERYTIRLGNTAVISAGCEYEFKARDFHDTVCVDGTVTVIEKLGYDKQHQPGVMVPTGLTPDNNFSRSAMSETLLWELLRQDISDSV